MLCDCGACFCFPIVSCICELKCQPVTGELDSETQTTNQHRKTADQQGETEVQESLTNEREKQMPTVPILIQILNSANGGSVAIQA